MWRAANGIAPGDRRPTGAGQLQTASALWQHHLDRSLARCNGLGRHEVRERQAVGSSRDRQPEDHSACPNHPRSARPRRRPASACSSTVAHSRRIEEPDTLTGSISRYRQHLPNVALVDQGAARGASDGAATRCYPILRATATTPTSRPRAPVTDRTTRHHGRYRWNPSPDARECAPSHRRCPGAARSFRPSPHPSTGPFHSRKESRSPKHLAADPWTPPPSRLVSASIG